MRWRWPRHAETVNVPSALFRKWMAEAQAEIDAKKQAEAQKAKVFRLADHVAAPAPRPPFLVPLRRRA